MGTGEYKVIVSRAAADDVRRLTLAVSNRIRRAIEDLKNFPNVSNVRKMAGYENLWRRRVGDYRIVFEVDNQTVVITVIKAVHRRDAYE